MTSFDFTFSKPGQSSPKRREKPQCRLLVLCDARGENPDRPPLSQRRARLLDIDVFDALLGHYAPGCVLGDDHRLAITELEHFSPDWLYRHVPRFAAMPHAAPQSMPATPKPADDEDDTVERLLGRPAQTDTPAKRASGLLDQFIRNMADVESEAPEPSVPDTASLTNALCEVLHTPGFQHIEAIWRGLHELASGVDATDGLHIKMLDVTPAELVDDLRQAEHSVLAERLLGDESGWDWIILPHTLTPDDATLIAGLGSLAGAIGARVLCDVDITALNAEPAPNWEALRTSPAAPHVVAATPRVLLRPPYGAQFESPDQFDFEECAGKPKNDELLFGSSALLLATCLAQSFEAGKPAANLSDQPAANDRPQFVYEQDGERTAQPVTEVLLSDARAEELASVWGVLPVRAASRGNRLHVVELESLVVG